MSEPLTDDDLGSLCQAAEAAGLRFRAYAGGAMLLEPWPQVRAAPALVDILRRHLPALVQYLGRVDRPDLLTRDWLAAYTRAETARLEDAAGGPVHD